MTGSVQATYIEEVTAANPFLYYHLDDAGAAHTVTAVNSGVSGVNGTYYQCGCTGGSLTDITSPVSTGKQFNRDSFTSGAFVTAGGQGTAYSALGAFTVECLLRPNYDEDFQSIYASAGWDAGDLHLNVNSTGLGFSMAGVGLSADLPTTGLIPANTWAHVALTYADGTATFYLNGNAVGAVAGGNTAQTIDFNQEANIGYWQQGGNRYLDSTAIDEFAIYGTALSAQTIASHAIAAGFTPVPEPSSLALIVSAIAGLVCYAWRKR
jgi:hypothetical protein